MISICRWITSFVACEYSNLHIPVLSITVVTHHCLHFDSVISINVLCCVIQRIQKICLSHLPSHRWASDVECRVPNLTTVSTGDTNILSKPTSFTTGSRDPFGLFQTGICTDKTPARGTKGIQSSPSHKTSVPVTKPVDQGSVQGLSSDQTSQVSQFHRYSLLRLDSPRHFSIHALSTECVSLLSLNHIRHP